MNKDKQLNSIQNQIKDIRNKIVNLGNFRTGSLSVQYNVCGKANCKCKDKVNPQKHGPYNQLGFTFKGKHTTSFIKEENLEAVKSELANYKTMRALVKKWVELENELAILRIKK